MKITLQPVISGRNKKLLDAARVMREIESATRETVTGIQNDFKKTTATWNHKPTWYATRRGTVWYIGTKDEIYGYVDQGTPPHIITPKKPGGRLRFFRTGFRPKSRVGYISSYAGAKASKDLTYTKIVHHPGTKARGFSEKIADKWRKKWAGRIRQAIHEASL